MSLIHLMRWVNSKEETFLVKFRFITGYSNAILKLQCMAHTVPVPCKAGDVLFIISTNACLLSGIIEGVRDYVLKSHPEERMYVWETVAVMEKYWKNNSHPEEIQRQIQDCPWLQWRKKDKELKGGKPPAIHQSHLKLKNLLVDYTFYTRMIANCGLGAQTSSSSSPNCQLSSWCTPRSHRAASCPKRSETNPDLLTWKILCWPSSKTGFCCFFPRTSLS